MSAPDVCRPAPCAVAAGLEPRELEIVAQWSGGRGYHLLVAQPPRVVPIRDALPTQRAPLSPRSVVELVILDLLALPDVFGEELCRCARVVCIGGQGAAPPASRALRAGAFDYVARSCDREELEARLDCAASRAKPRVVVRLDAARSTVEALGIELPLRPAELAVLAEIVGHPTVPIPSRHLVSRALGASGDGGSARNQVFEVRRKFREAGLPDPVKTLPGSGYCVADSVVITLTQTGE